MRKNLEKTWKNGQNLKKPGKKPGKWARAFSRYLDENVSSCYISCDMTLEIKVMIILVLTSNRNLEKPGKFV